MSQFTFYKYQGTGNDFVMIDNRKKVFDVANVSLIQKICDRRFGVGADGLILIEHSPDADFEMIYFNSDGSKSFCGNGSRCAVAFAAFLGMIKSECTFIAIDGKHSGKLTDNNRVEISVRDVNTAEKGPDHYFIHTGSPHYIKYVSNLDEFPVIEEAQKIRYNERFKAEGTNVNFVEIVNDGIKVRTYERGVEDETLSCGSGVTACALSLALLKNQDSKCTVHTQGGELLVKFNRKSDTSFEHIRLSGPAEQVFKGEWNEK